MTQVALARIYEAQSLLRCDTGERADAAFALAAALDVFAERGMRTLVGHGPDGAQPRETARLARRMPDQAAATSPVVRRMRQKRMVRSAVSLGNSL